MTSTAGMRGLGLGPGVCAGVVATACAVVAAGGCCRGVLFGLGFVGGRRVLRPGINRKSEQKSDESEFHDVISVSMSKWSGPKSAREETQLFRHTCRGEWQSQFRRTVVNSE